MPLDNRKTKRDISHEMRAWRNLPHGERIGIIAVLLARLDQDDLDEVAAIALQHEMASALLSEDVD